MIAILQMLISDLKHIPHKLLNKLYFRNYKLYQWIYFIYKLLSDKDKIDLIGKYVKPGDVCVDIGANVGFYSLLLSKIVGSTGQVFAFEPESNNYFHLRNNTKGNKNIKTIKAAVGNRNTNIFLYVSGELNVDHHTYDIGEGRKKTSIKVISLDTFLTELPSPTFIKMDIQGYEFQAAKGMRKLLKKGGVVVMSELWPYGISKAGSSWGEYLKYFEDMGYKIKFFIDKPRSTIKKHESDSLFYTDVLFYKK